MQNHHISASRNAPRVVSFINTKGGGGKSTLAANTVGFLADAGWKVLGIDLDTQPSFTSYYQLTQEAPGGVYELLLNRNTSPEAVISHTSLTNFHLIKSNDPHDQLKNHLLSAPDGRLRLRQLLSAFSDYDVIVIDTQGAYSVLPQIATFSSDIICCPTVPAIADAREFFRGTMSMFAELQSLYKMLGLPREFTVRCGLAGVLVSQGDAGNISSVLWLTVSVGAPVLLFGGTWKKMKAPVSGYQPPIKRATVRGIKLRLVLWGT